MSGSRKTAAGTPASPPPEDEQQPVAEAAPAAPAVETERARVAAVQAVADEAAMPIQPDPLPDPARPIVEVSMGAPTVHYFGEHEHPPEVVAAVETLRAHLGELRSFLMGFRHHAHIEHTPLGEIVAFLKEKLHVASPD